MTTVDRPGFTLEVPQNSDVLSGFFDAGREAARAGDGDELIRRQAPV